MAFMFRTVKGIFWLLVGVCVLFTASLFATGGLLAKYQQFYEAIYQKPATEAAGFRSWSSDTELALGRADSGRALRSWWWLLSFPGFQSDIYALESEFQAMNQDYAALLADMTDVFPKNPMLQAAWERSVLRSGADSTISAGELGASIMNLISEFDASGDVIRRYMAFADRKKALIEHKERILSRLEAEKAFYVERATSMMP